MTRQSRWRDFSDFNELRIFMAGRLLVLLVLSCWRVPRNRGPPRERSRSSQGGRARAADFAVGAAVTLDILLFLAGLALAGLTLRDVFDTVVVPGGSRASLRVAHRLRVALLPLWKSLGGRRGISGAFAPMILVGSFIIWMSFLALGFGLMAYAARYHFQPHLRSFGDAVYLVGSALVTVGLSESNPFGAGRWIILAAGFCGLGVMTMAVTY